ncbi:hypothetical protein C2845_PM09G11470 [Panicum miliaceum]|uniref:Uncharacterized protein n=1 Tax=Panicum miliaceum TaxID=4540 RepID=A0A3L6RYU1_PANMI|nr:hypothetical protein C2845_PM09G11470 [Panicum miliaceum]
MVSLSFPSLATIVSSASGAAETASSETMASISQDVAAEDAVVATSGRRSSTSHMRSPPRHQSLGHRPGPSAPAPRRASTGEASSRRQRWTRTGGG